MVSQSLSNLVAAHQAANQPVLRLLLAFDKLDMMDEARRLGTADIAPYRTATNCYDLVG